VRWGGVGWGGVDGVGIGMRDEGFGRGSCSRGEAWFLVLKSV